ncbi:flagellar motor switch protein FliM [Sphaerobacter thermophilus]|uniref:flagellar motor switch protein FliM n=1 Tax=Sphaerobacter thermophilus TaxID=2057 RepID=UPI000DB2EA07|nr:MAG: flagellar motor switch protein FliM [Sphaerobacter thermophilus]
MSGSPVPYNFRRPDKFSKDHLRSIQAIQEGFGRFAGNFLASKVRAAVHVSLVHVEQSTLGEFLDGLPFPTTLFISPLDPLVGQAVMQIDMNLAFLVIDRMLGGPGDSTPVPRAGASVTEIEMLLLEELGQGLFAEFVNAWAQVTSLRAPHCEVALGAMQVQGLLPTEIALVIRHEVRMEGATGRLTICLPASMLEPILPRLNARLLFANPRAGVGEQLERDLAAQLERVSLAVRVELGRVTVRVADLLQVEVGDVIRLDTAADSALPVLVEDRVRFLGQPGQIAGQLAVRIVERVTDDTVVP